MKNHFPYFLLVLFFHGCIGETVKNQEPVVGSRTNEETEKAESFPWEENQMLTQLNMRDLLKRTMSEPLAYELLARPSIPKDNHYEAVDYLKGINNRSFGDQVIDTILLLKERGVNLNHLGTLLLETEDLDFEKTWDAIGKVYSDEGLTSYFFAGLLLSDYEEAKSSIEMEEDGMFILMDSISLIPDGEVRESLTDYTVDILLNAMIDDLDILETGILAMRDNEYGLNTMKDSLAATSTSHPSMRIRFAALEALGKEVKTIEMKAISVMKYDVTSFSVKPGQAVRIILKNEESMPHNIVITEPGSFPDKVIEELAELYGSSDAAELDYIPQTETVLFYTPLVYVNESTTLLFFAPSEEGIYPYVCTYPGHWATMNGVMEVRN